jgi:bifunctional UDP-N-acetylglucosamine pyrophosphorylase/glucosamine-1-phosphate N-acetyltransferase/UDP-N-acetylglucosamine pyrophosphorylase
MADIQLSTTQTGGLKAVVLAGGKGTRLGSDGAGIPKAMRDLCGKPLLGYVLDALSFLPPEDIVIVIGYMKENITGAFGGLNYSFAVQAEQKGTGDAAKAAKSSLAGFRGDVIVCYGDMPLMRRETYVQLAEYHRYNNCDCTMLAGMPSKIVDLSAFGRLRINADGTFDRIVEARDLTPEDKSAEDSGTAVPLFNSGVYVFKADRLFTALDDLQPANSQGEYYLTDAPAIIAKQGGIVKTVAIDLDYQIQGVNTLDDLHSAERYLQNAN